MLEWATNKLDELEAEIADKCPDTESPMRVQLDALIARGRRWVAKDPTIKEDREQYFDARYKEIDAPCGDATSSEGCTCEPGTVCMRKGLHSALYGISEEEAAVYNVRPFTGFKDKEFTDGLAFVETCKIVEAITAKLKSLEVNDEDI